VVAADQLVHDRLFELFLHENLTESFIKETIATIERLGILEQRRNEY
jgi:hypothetical protein